MENSGTAIMGSATAEGENRAIKAVEEALASPLLNDNQIKGASDILLYISSGNEEITMDEVSDITDFIQEEAGQSAEIIWGNGIDESLDNKISITLVATGFKSEEDPGLLRRPAKRKVIPLNTIKPEEKKIRPKITEPINEITLITPKKEEEKEISNTGDSKVENKPLEFSFTEEKIDIKPTDSVEPVVLNETKVQKPEPKPFKPINPDTIIRKVDYAEGIEQSDIEKKSKERIRRLKDLSIKLRSNEEIEEMESVPAYKRRNIELSDVTPSSESVAAR
jgi:cell division protein FtsZ